MIKYDILLLYYTMSSNNTNQSNNIFNLVRSNIRNITIKILSGNDINLKININDELGVILQNIFEKYVFKMS